MHVSHHLDVPLRAQNAILVAAGFAPRYPESELTAPPIASVMHGLRRLLDAHHPYPALLLDDGWDVVDANVAAQELLEGCAAHLLEPPVNVVRLCVHPQGLAPRIGNLDEWAAHLYQQVIHRAQHRHESRLEELASEMCGLLGRTPRADAATGPVLALEIEAPRGLQRFFSTSARLSMANDVTLDALHLETFLPADETTRLRLAG